MKDTLFLVCLVRISASNDFGAGVSGHAEMSFDVESEEEADRMVLFFRRQYYSPEFAGVLPLRLMRPNHVVRDYHTCVWNNGDRTMTELPVTQKVTP